MPAKPAFTPEEREVIYEAAVRVWDAKFAHMKKRTREHPPGQEAMALALGVSQQSISALLHRKYKPGVTVARHIANLDGKTLEQLLPHWGRSAPRPIETAPDADERLANLDVCTRFYASRQRWSAWTVAAARAGYFGRCDVEPTDWERRLDHLEKALERAKKGTK